MSKEKKIKRQRSLPRKILNGFIGLFGVAVFLFILFLGFSQTKKFHNLLREKIISYYNDNFNGKLSIGEINGSLFSSLDVNDIQITKNGRTFLSCKDLSVKLNPLLIFRRRLRINKISLTDAHLNIAEIEKGKWNFNSLVKDTTAAKDSTILRDSTTVENKGASQSDFPFEITVDAFEIKNLNFSLRDFEHLNSDSVYKTMNYGDIRLNDINLNATVFINLVTPRFNLILNDLSSKTNLTRFNLKHFSGFFYLDSQKALADNVSLETDSSNINFTMEMDSVNFFKPFEYSNFKNHPVKLKLNAEPFCFEDLSSFLEATEFFKGKPTLSFQAEGPYGNLKIKEMKLKLGSSEISGFGKISNLEQPSDLRLNVTFENSRLDESDAFRLMPSLGIPDFNELTLSKVNVHFKGKPTNFFTKIEAHTGSSGNLKLAGNLNLDLPQMKYNFKFASQKLDLSKIINVSTLLNMNGKIKGSGVNPVALKALFNLTVSQSRINGYKIDTLNLASNSSNKMIRLNLLTDVNGAHSELEGKLDFTDETSPRYDLTGVIDSLDLARFAGDKSLNSNLNFSFVARGKNLNIDDMVADFIVGLRRSELKGHSLQSSKFTLALRKDKSNREIKFTSDLLDLTLQGKFSLSRAIKLLNYQSGAIAQMFKNKFRQINPATVLENKEVKLVSQPYDTIAAKPLEFNYGFSVKKFEPIAVLLNAEEFDVAGSGSGMVKNDSLNFSISGNYKLDNFFNTDKHSLLYLSGVDADMHFSRNNLSNKFNSLFGSLSLSGEKIFIGKEIKNISADVVFNQSKLIFDAGASIGKDLAVESEGEFEMSPKKQRIIFSFLKLNYKGDEWQNDSNIVFAVSQDSFLVNNFSLSNGAAYFRANGQVGKNKGQNIKFVVRNFPSYLAAKYFTNMDDSQIKGKFNLNAEITGTSERPLANISANIDSVGYGESFFGNLTSNFSFANNLLGTDVKFKEFEEKGAKTLLTISGGIPLEITSEFEAVKNQRKVNLKIHSKNFQIASFGSLVPLTGDLKGLLNIDVDVTGLLSDLNYSGNISLKDCSFRSRLNNLDYEFGTRIKLENKLVTVSKIFLRNSEQSKYRGEIDGKGNFKLAGFKPEGFNFTFQGSLQALSKKSKIISPNFYGDLFVQSDGNITLSTVGKKMKLIGGVKVQNADLTIVPAGSGNAVPQGKIIYDIIADSSKINLRERKYREYLSLIKGEKKEKKKCVKIPFDYNIQIDFNKAAKMEIILSKIWNQKLVMLMKGSLDYLSENGEARTQGALVLQPGSKLEFIKTFDATGKIKFETDPANPYLDVVATYLGTYNNGTDLKANYIDVEVEMKLKGTLDKLGTSLMTNPNSISIYKGEENIKNKVRDNRYDISDAILFVYLGRFKEDLTAQDKSKLAGISNTATSFLGSTISGILNSVVGDVVSDIKIDEHGNDTRITISGRYQNIRYTLSGTTKIQNINEANIKFEYQLFPNFILRLERKDPVVRTFGLEEKISELGLKYKVEF